MQVEVNGVVSLSSRHCDQALAFIGDREPVMLPSYTARASMAKNTPPPACSKCGRATRFMLVRSGGRKFCFIYFGVPDAPKTPGKKKLLGGAFNTPKTGVFRRPGLFLFMARCWRVLS